MSEQMKNLGSKLPNGGRIGAALKFVAGAGIVGAALYNGVYNVEGGHRAVRVCLSRRVHLIANLSYTYR